MTDDCIGYENVGAHSRADTIESATASASTIEGVFSVLERGIYGTYHSISKQHLHCCLVEFEFRHDTRKLRDGERAERALCSAEGCRSRYRVTLPRRSGHPIGAEARGRSLAREAAT